MQDIRLRTLTAVLLSISAFASIAGAVAAFVWWILFTRRFAGSAGKARALVPAAAMILFFAGVSSLAGGDGPSYAVRMLILLLVGFWVWTEYDDGGFLRLGTWLLGNRIGFELGMLAGLGMQALDELFSDYDRIRLAHRLKGITFGYRSLVPAGIVLVSGTIGRAGQAAEILAARGYRDGGSLCPSFVTPRRDIAVTLAAVCVLVIALLPRVHLFILS